jgi:hypothetical protein
MSAVSLFTALAASVVLAAPRQPVPLTGNKTLVLRLCWSEAACNDGRQGVAFLGEGDVPFAPSRANGGELYEYVNLHVALGPGFFDYLASGSLRERAESPLSDDETLRAPTLRDAVIDALRALGPTLSEEDPRWFEPARLRITLSGPRPVRCAPGPTSRPAP